MGRIDMALSDRRVDLHARMTKYARGKGGVAAVGEKREGEAAETGQT